MYSKHICHIVLACSDTPTNRENLTSATKVSMCKCCALCVWAGITVVYFFLMGYVGKLIFLEAQRHEKHDMQGHLKTLTAEEFWRVDNVLLLSGLVITAATFVVLCVLSALCNGVKRCFCGILTRGIGDCCGEDGHGNSRASNWYNRNYGEDP